VVGAVVAVRVMKVAADVVVCLIAVRNRVMAATGTMDVARLVPAASMVRRADIGVIA
jgi:hypothetical protein